MCDETLVTELPTQAANDCLQEIIKNEFHLKDPKVEITAGSAKGDNYLGIIYRIHICDTNDNSEHYVIAKLPPTNQARREQFFARTSFLREIIFYDEYLPLLMEFQREKGINVERDGFHEVPRCLKTCSLEPEEAIFLEDLKPFGFQMFDRLMEITMAQVEPVMRVLGKYHALGFAIKQQRPEKIEKLRALEEFFLMRPEPDPMDDWVGMLKQRALTTLEEEKDGDILPKIREYFAKSWREAMKECVDKEAAEPYAIVCHGDCWNNNIMYQYQDDEFKGDIRILDWQILRYASPVLDLVYYLFGSATKKIRSNYQDLLKIYHKSLSDMLERLGCDPETTFPFSALEKQLKQFGKFGLLMAVMILPIITADAEDVPDLEETAEKMQAGEIGVIDEAFKSEKRGDAYKERMSDSLRDAVEFGYL